MTGFKNFILRGNLVESTPNLRLQGRLRRRRVENLGACHLDGCAVLVWLVRQLGWIEERQCAYLDGALLENHASGDHDLLIGPGNVEIPASTVVCEKVGYVTAVEGHGHHCELLNSICVLVCGGIVGVGVGVGGRGVCRGRVTMTRPAWISKRCGVDIHVCWKRRAGMWIGGY